MELLEAKQLVDVTLVADGHMFSVHRLILSTLSPYFRKMFTQMPANQPETNEISDYKSNFQDNNCSFRKNLFQNSFVI